MDIYIVFSTKLLNLAPKRPAPKLLCALTSRAQTAAPKRHVPNKVCSML